MPKVRSTSTIVQENLARARKHRKYTLRELADRTAAVGYPLTHTALYAIESGTRGVDVDDLTALAAALEISPAGLLMPNASNKESRVQFAGVPEITASDAWEWITASLNPQRAPDDLVGLTLSRPAWSLSLDDTSTSRSVEDTERYWAKYRALYGKFVRAELPPIQSERPLVLFDDRGQRLQLSHVGAGNRGVGTRAAVQILVEAGFGDNKSLGEIVFKSDRLDNEWPLIFTREV